MCERLGRRSNCYLLLGVILRRREKLNRTVIVISMINGVVKTLRDRLRAKAAAAIVRRGKCDAQARNATITVSIV